MVYLGNAFSLQMLEGDCSVRISTIGLDEVKRVIADGYKSIMGHQDIASIVSDMLGVEVNYNRESVILGTGDVLVVFQVVGGRLPEGATKLPDNVQLKVYMVRVV